MKKGFQLLMMISFFLAGQNATAQMGAAKTMQFDIDTVVVFKAKVDTVWKLVKDPARWNEISNGFITKIETKGDLQTGLLKTVTFADGRVREDIVKQFQPEHRFIVFEAKSPLPAGVKDNVALLTLKVDPGVGTQMVYKIMVNGSAAGKQELLVAMRDEMRAMIAGMNKALGQ